MAREVVTLHQFLNRLSPEFDDCPRLCALEDGAERESFCDDCDAKAQYEFFERSFEDTARRQNLSKDYSFATLYGDVTRVMAVNFEKRRGYPKGCSATEAQLLDIVRYELSRPARVANWELDQKLKSKGDG
jgi:hypothetical protein